MIWAIMKEKGKEPPSYYYKKIPLKNYDFYLLYKGNFEDWQYRKTKEGIIFTSKKAILINPISEWDANAKEYCAFLRKLPLTTRKWSSIEPQKTKSKRAKLLEKYGPYAFLDPVHLKYPIISKDGKFSEKGLLAAYKRAQQWKDEKIAQLAEEIGKCMNFAWAKLNPSSLVSIWFDRKYWNLTSARKYLRDNGLRYQEYIKTQDYYKFPQKDKEDYENFEKRYYGDGIIQIIGIKNLTLNPNMPYNVNMQTYSELYKKYLEDGKELLEKGDYVQASEKYWGAAAEIVKAVGAKMGENLKSHRHLFKFVEELDEKYPKLELSYYFSYANVLHQNFYENYLSPKMAKKYIKKTEEFIKKMETFLK